MFKPFFYLSSLHRSHRRASSYNKQQRNRNLLVGELLEDRSLLATYVVDSLEDEIDLNYGAGHFSLREAIDLANNNGPFSFDEIQIAPHLRNGLIKLNPALGALSVTNYIDLSGNGITIDGQNQTRLFSVNTNTAYLSDLILQHGFSTTAGGALVSQANFLSLIRCQFRNNTSTASGGAVAVDSGTVKAFNSDFISNSASFGGAFYVNTGDLQLEGTNVLQNNANAEGGGIYNGSGTVEVTASSFISNTATADSGAIINLNGFVGIANSTFAKNSSPSVGAIWNLANMIVSNSTIAENVSGGATGALDTLTGASTELYNTILVGNVGNNIDLSGDVYQFSQNNLLGSGTPLPPNLGNITGANFLETLLPLAYNGARTLNYMPTPWSSAIDAGSNDVAIDRFGGQLFTDQLNFERYLDGNLDSSTDINERFTVDIGSVEADPFTSPLVVNSTNDLGYLDGSSYSAGTLRLREAIAIANLMFGKDTITFSLSPLSQKSIELLDQLLVLSDLSIVGPGSDKLKLDGLEATRLIKVGIGFELNLTGLTLANGKAQEGAAIWNAGRHLTLDDVAAENNWAYDDPNIGGNPQGAVIHNPTEDENANPIDVDSVVEVTNSRFTGNHSDNFAGVFRMFMGDSLVVRTSDFVGNSAGNGGVTANAAGPIEIYDSMFVNNTSDGFGGALRSFGPLTVARSSFVGNKSLNEGGAIGMGAGSLTVINSTFYENQSQFGGGAIHSPNQPGQENKVINSTIINNIAVDADDGNAVPSAGGIGGAAFQLVNTIVSGNLAFNAPFEIQIDATDPTKSFNNIIGDANTAGGLTNGTNGNQLGVDPKLEPVVLSNNRYFAVPMANSPALDAGSTARALDQNGLPLATDQRRTGFARTINGTVDIGAIELQSPGVALLIDKTLSIEGTSSSDVITVDSDSVLVNGVDYGYGPEEVLEIEIWGREGGDTINVVGVAPGVSTIRIYGEEGNDKISVSSTVTVSAELQGGSGNDTLEGGGGSDFLGGGANDDTYVFDTDNFLGSDVIDEFFGGTDTLDFSSTTSRSVTVDLSLTTPQAINAGLTLTLFQGDQLENIIGGALGDNLIGNSLGNIFTGNGGDDTMIGGPGNDKYNFDTDNALGSDTINESGGGIDLLNFSTTTTRAVVVDLSKPTTQVINAGLSLTLGAGNVIENIIGGAQGDTLKGNSLSNAFNALGGDDLMIGGAGNDSYVFDTDNALGSDTIDESGGGSDTLDFGTTSTRAVVINLAKATMQTVNAGLNLTLGSGTTLENVIGGGLGDTMTGNTLANVLTGLGGDDLLTGQSGDDTYVFDTDNALGSDTINESGGGLDTLDFSATTTRAITIDLSKTTSQIINPGLTLKLNQGNTLENIIGGAQGDHLTGNGLANIFTGNGGDDTMAGGAGNDKYNFDTDNALGSDTINEAGGGVDMLNFSTTTTRSVVVDLSKSTAQVVNAGLTLTLGSGTTIENLIGGTQSDTLTGNILSNAIVGLEGSDVMTGLSGDDTYIFDTDFALGTDTINEAGGGLDTLDFGATTTRTVVIDLSKATQQTVNAGLKLILGSGSTMENVIGGALSDTITGNSLANKLTGLGGDDLLTGGPGNDNYIFDTDNNLGSDTINESGGQDTLDFSPTSTRAILIDLSNPLPQIVNAGLTLTLNSGTSLENVYGGAQSDILTGNSLANYFSGNGGNDTMIGGSGNDWYDFDADFMLGSDTISDSSGVDTVSFSSTTTRSVAVDLSKANAQSINIGLTLALGSGSAIENLIGGNLGDTLTGNALSNVLNGLAGDDLLKGLTGNDTYVFDTDNALGSDTIIEAGGFDTLDFSTTTTRSVAVDLSNAAAQTVNAGLTLTLGSSTAIESILGGQLGDTLTGNAISNALTGNGGDDTLNGGSGNDVYYFDTDTPLGSDTINEAAGGIDTLSFVQTTSRSVSVDLSNAAAQVVNAGLTLTLGSSTTVENLVGGSLGDTLVGNSLNNSLTGNGGDDTLTGAAGDDVYIFDTDVTLGSDTINESGGGVDTLDFSSTTTRTVIVSLANAAAQVINAGLTLTLGSASTMENVLGGTRGDFITGNGLANLLSGNAGNDTISGGGGQDVLLGGLSTDSLSGDAGEDLLIGGTTSHDANQAALLAILSEWSRTNQTYAQRIGHLSTSSGGNNGSTLLNASTVQDDSGAVDQLTGGTSLDWFFASLNDNLLDKAANETQTNI